MYLFNPLAPYILALGILLFLLTARIIKVRKALKVALGDANDHTLMRAIRAQANFLEYVPFMLIVLYTLLTMNVAPIVLHIVAMSLLIGRCLHAYAFTMQVEKMRIRMVGMLMTLTSLLVGLASIAWYLIEAMML